MSSKSFVLAKILLILFVQAPPSSVSDSPLLLHLSQGLSEYPGLLAPRIQLGHFSEGLPCLLSNFLPTAAPILSPPPIPCFLAFLVREVEPHLCLLQHNSTAVVCIPIKEHPE